MPISLTFPQSTSRACTIRDATAIWSVAAQLRRHLGSGRGPDLAINGGELATACQRLEVNDLLVKVAWDFDHRVHDEEGAEVFGVCETDGESDCALVSINGPLLKDRFDMLLSTTSHELGHVIFDVPASIQAERRYRRFTANDNALFQSRGQSEWRANEFMGALLTPPFLLHRQLLRHARAEGLEFVRAKHAGRPTWPAIGRHNDPDALAGVIDVLATDFGVSPPFIQVRLGRYGLVNRTQGERP